MNWFEINDIKNIDTPVLVVFPDRVKHNIRTALKMVGSPDRLRPHVKTNKSPEAMQLMIDAGITQFKCATIAEAEVLGQLKARDVLLAYQVLGPKLQRFISLIRNYPDTQFSCLCDNENAAREQAATFLAAGLSVPVFIDLNIGMNRTGIVPGEAAKKLYEFLSVSHGVEAAGFHAYDGHMRHPDIKERKKLCDVGFQAVIDLKASLEAEGFRVPTVIAGGSPSFPVHAEQPGVQCSPGTFIYWDKGYSDICPEQDLLPAAVLVTRVISLPSSNRICTDLGHKSVAAENDISKRVSFLNAEGVTPVGQSEEHLVLEVAEDHSFQTGDVLYALPYHVCPTVALYERIITIEEGHSTGYWLNSARDRMINY